jgi:hypothetical protein
MNKGFKFGEREIYYFILIHHPTKINNEFELYRGTKQDKEENMKFYH